MLDDYIARFERGEHPDPLAYRERAGEDWPGLALAIDRYLVGASPPAPSAVDVEAMRLLVAGTPPLLGMRARRGIPRAQVVSGLMCRFGFGERLRGAVALRYHQLEAGLLPLGGVDEGVFQAVAQALGVERRSILAWPAPRPSAPVFARAADPAQAAPSHPTDDAPDTAAPEVDRVFGVGG